MYNTKDYTLPNEIWKDIQGFNGVYQASNLGRIRTTDHYVNYRNNSKAIRRGKVLKAQKTKKGYYTIGLKKDGVIIRNHIHRFIAQTFIENRKNKLQVNHIDGDKENNNISNLEWATPKENTRHAIEVLGYDFVKPLRKYWVIHSKKIIGEYNNKKYYFKSMSDASRYILGLRGDEITPGAVRAMVSNIGAVCKGDYKKSYGWCFKYDNQSPSRGDS